jgi:23S rRNA pseudouridine2605 synthase
VSVNGLVVAEVGARADPLRDEIALDGERLGRRPRSWTIVLHKPRGVVSTMADPEGRPTVRELLADLGERLYPVGRLDLQSSGLLLLTNDGALANGLLHPRHGVERVYHVKVHGSPDARTLGRLRRGLRLDEGVIVPSRVRRLRTLPRKTWLEIGVREGRQHVVRRLCKALALPVDKLVRVRLGPIALGELPPGAWRGLTPTELGVLRRVAGISAPRSAGDAATGRGSRAAGTRPRTPPRPPGDRSPREGRGAPRARDGGASSPRGSRPGRGRPRA